MIILLEIAIENLLNEEYEKTNNINEACKIVENEFHAFRITSETDNDNHKVFISSTINNKIITTINIPNKK